MSGGGGATPTRSVSSVSEGSASLTLRVSLHRIACPTSIARRTCGSGVCLTISSVVAASGNRLTDVSSLQILPYFRFFDFASVFFFAVAGAGFAAVDFFAVRGLLSCAFFAGFFFSRTPFANRSVNRAGADCRL